jgi:hypothetical protein
MSSSITVSQSMVGMGVLGFTLTLLCASAVTDGYRKRRDAAKPSKIIICNESSERVVSDIRASSASSLSSAVMTGEKNSSEATSTIKSNPVIVTSVTEMKSKSAIEMFFRKLGAEYHYASTTETTTTTTTGQGEHLSFDFYD